MDERAWLRKGAAILTDIKEWRCAHPKATFVEMEDEIHRRMMELEAQVLQDAAQASECQEWGQMPGQPTPLCPACAVPLQARGQQQRTLQGNGGQSVTLHRTYGTCPTCHQSFFPLDRELDLLPGSLAPRQYEHLVHLASCLPFGQAARLLGDLLGVQVSKETARRLSEQMGAWMDAARCEEAEPIASRASPGPSTSSAPERCVLSADGAMISLVHKQWVEVRTLAIGEPVEKPETTGEADAHVDHLSYFSHLADASTFLELVAGETRRRKVAQAKQVCAVTDGAEWCQAFANRYRPDAVRILDFPHAAEHVSALLEGCSQAGIPLPEQMLSRCLHILKHRGPTALLHMADRLCPELAQQKGIGEHVEYLRKREASIRYPQFRAQGWPIGSGMVESANKLVVQARLKGPGMHWERTNVNSILALRLAVCNDRWAEMWSKALASAQGQSARHPSPCSRQKASSHTDPVPATSPQEGSRSSPSPLLRPRHAPSPRVNAAAPSSEKAVAERPGCRVCGAELVRVRGHRCRQYCSDRCRTRAYRSRRPTDTSRLSTPIRLKHEATSPTPRLPHPRVPRPRFPFVKTYVDRCPCGTPVVQCQGARSHRPRQYCSDRCRQRAHRWRQVVNARELMNSFHTGNCLPVRS